MRRSVTRTLAPAAALALLVALSGCASGSAPAAPPAPATAPSTQSATPSSPEPAGWSAEHFGPDAVSFVSATEGWALAEGGCGHCGVVYRTADAGRHWDVIAWPTLPGGAHTLIEGLTDLSFADARDGYIFTGAHCGSGCLLATHDGGRSWHAVALTAVVELVATADAAYALTSPGPRGDVLLRRSPVGSDDWTPIVLPVASPALKLAAQGDALALLDPGMDLDPTTEQLGRVWYSADRGDHWSDRPIPCRTSDGGGAALVSLALGHPEALLVDCFENLQVEQEQQTRHHLYGSADAGRTWVRLADPTRIGAPVLMADNGAGHAFLATESGGTNILAVTLDGAAHWHTAISTSAGFFGWGDLRFVSASVGFVLGPTHYAPVHLYRTTDGGRTWHQLPLPGPAG